MDLATDSSFPEETRAWLRPRLRTVFIGVGFLAFLLALGGLAWARLYDSQLIRETESELIAQGVVLAKTMERFLDPNRHFIGTHDGSAINPIVPSLSAQDDVLPPARILETVDAAPSPEWLSVSGTINPFLRKISLSTLAGIMVVDSRGVVVAASNEMTGRLVSDNVEFESAIKGVAKSVLRQRDHEVSRAPLQSLSRGASIRVWVAIPLMRGEEVVGAVLLSRTPMTLAKVVYADRWNLGVTGMVLISAIAVTSLLASIWVQRPITRLLKQAQAISKDEVPALRSSHFFGIEELEQLSRALARMSSELRRRNDYIRSFAASVSHEFKTPLSSIQGSVELLLENADTMPHETRRKFLSNIDADARRLTQLVSQLLELAKADSTKEETTETELSSILKEISQRAISQGLECEVRNFAPDAVVSIRREALESVLWQLCVNAQKHGKATKIILEARKAEGGTDIQLRVIDNGSGISVENQLRIFDAFFTTARSEGGTGLGLTIARSVLRAFNGQLHVEPSTAEKGAAFLVTLKSRGSAASLP